ncbi:hypothetical protein Afe04nite_20570 [Asanoa ferruginea]|uniref:sensor histidine kinase n=1 Tax=Asanoa ferruginea TaxID=53367 RepID=UPI000E25677F|nr:ATP-binding protein [Asanoa ferruginea]GIF47518.1 hypothetical protein Afe04nite_20570 [Asanoa ferruginea]
MNAPTWPEEAWKWAVARLCLSFIAAVILLDRLVRNLVDNAIRHNHRGGWIEMTTRHEPDGVLVVVRNSGEQIPSAEIDRLFEPFQRLDPNRVMGGGSSGLGLAIVRSFVHAHRGNVVATPEPSGGLTITVTLPTTRPRSDADRTRIAHDAR